MVDRIPPSNLTGLSASAVTPSSAKVSRNAARQYRDRFPGWRPGFAP